MSNWFDDPQQLFRADKVFEFWPTNKQDISERVNAATRFIIYATCIIYIIRRDARIFVLGGMVIGILYVMFKSGMIKKSSGRPVNRPLDSCQEPTEDNPMANFSYPSDPQKSPACYSPTVSPMLKEYVDDRFPYDAGRSRSPMPDIQRKAASRQFVSQSSNFRDGGEQTAFAEWCYGPKFQPMCKSDGGICDPNARGVQLEAFGGLDPDGKRSGMSRGTVFS